MNIDANEINSFCRFTSKSKKRDLNILKETIRKNIDKWPRITNENIEEVVKDPSLIEIMGKCQDLIVSDLYIYYENYHFANPDFEFSLEAINIFSATLFNNIYMNIISEK